MGPASENGKYVISPQGGHLATVIGKGSRVIVVLDGVAGPKFDEILTPTMPFVDPRPFEAEGRAAGTLGINVRPLAPVTFSRDGKRFAYLARVGQEWVLMADSAEVLRIPVTAGADLRMEFTGDDGKHLLFARSEYGGYALWVDGQKWPGLYGSGGGGTDGTIDPITSPDGVHLAYVAVMDQRGEKRALIVDGKDAGYFGTRLQYTPDSKHLISINDSPKGQAVLVDGKSIFTARQVLNVYVAPVGNRVAYALTHFSKDGSHAEGSFLLVDGKPVEASLTPEPNIGEFYFSPDGMHYAAVCGAVQHRFVVIDGKKGQEYFDIDKGIAGLAQGIAFSADSSKVIYSAYTGQSHFIVVNDDESDAFSVTGHFWLSPDGKRLAYGGATDRGMQTWQLMIDGKKQPLPPGRNVDLLGFSPDGSRYAFSGSLGGNKEISLDGQLTDLVGDFMFSADSKHFAVLGFRPIENKGGLFVDGQQVFDTYDKMISYQAFTPDGRHMYWMTREPGIGTNVPVGFTQFVVYLDGVPVARCDATGSAQIPLASGLSRFGRTGWKSPPSWSVNSAGVLTFFGAVNDDVKKFTVTPSAETSVDTMIAEAKAAPARAAAAKKAQADAAAAKAKADYDAAMAKRKADYDAAVAKQKADYEAAVAKRKADYDAAVAARAEQLKQQQQKK